MPLLDMPLKELKQYMGINPCPQDFDEYWKDALFEADKVQLNIELQKIDYPAASIEVFDLYYTGTNNARIHALYLRPVNIKYPAPCVLEFHGYTCSCGTIESKLKWLTLGYQVLSMDCRGQGGKSNDTGGVIGNTHNGHIIRGIEDKNTLLYKHIFLDTYLLAKIADSFDTIDSKNIMTIGGSQGGALSLVCAALSPFVKKSAACYPFLTDYKRVWEMDYSGAYKEISEWFRRFDPAHERADEIFTRLGYIDIKNLAPKIKADVLTCACLKDETCPPSTIYAMYNHLKCGKKIIIYPDFVHEHIDHWSEESFKFLAE